MRPNTMTWWGWQHVGVKNAEPTVEYVSATDLARKMVRVVADETVAQRIEIVVARTEAEVRGRLATRGNGSSNTPATTMTMMENAMDDEFMAEWMKGFDDLQAEEGNQ